MAAMAAFERQAVLQHCVRRFEERAEELAQLRCTEAGKPIRDSRGEFRDAGTGATLNVPLPAGCGDAEYLAVSQRLLVPAVEAFRPEIVIVSSGFDAHRDDPLASMQVTGAGFGAMARVVRALADVHCGGRLIVVLEGGYALTGLRESTAALLDALLSDHVRPPADARPHPLLDDIVDRVSAVHGRDFPGLARL